MTRGEKAAQTAKKNAATRREMDARLRDETAKVKRTLLAVLDDPASSPSEKLEAVRMLEKYHK